MDQRCANLENRNLICAIRFLKTRTLAPGVIIVIFILTRARALRTIFGDFAALAVAAGDALVAKQIILLCGFAASANVVNLGCAHYIALCWSCLVC